MKLASRDWFRPATILFASATFAFAGAPKAKPIEYHDTVITSINATSITISQDKVPKTFAITPTTEITLKGERAGVTALQPGMAVSVTQGATATTAARIAASAPPAHPALPPKPGKH